MTKLKVKNNYIDITNEWLRFNKSKLEVKELKCFNYYGKKYFVDNKKVVLDYSNVEFEIANFLVNNFGGKIFMVPRVNFPQGIETPDYLWNDEYWDLKVICGSGKNTLDSAIKKKRNQSCNFIFDVSYSKINIRECEKQINNIFNNNKRKWLNKIIIKNKKEVKVYKKRN